MFLQKKHISRSYFWFCPKPKGLFLIPIINRLRFLYIRTPYLKYFRMIFQVFINFMCLWVLETKHLTYLNEYLFLTKEKADSYTSICNASDIVKNIISISLVCFLKLKSSKKQTSIKCTTVSTVLWFYQFVSLRF